MEYNYGHFNEDGTEFVITDPRTPRAFDNFIWNEAVFSNVQHTGVGYCDYQVGTNEAVQLLTGVGRICDFDVRILSAGRADIIQLDLLQSPFS